MKLRIRYFSVRGVFRWTLALCVALSVSLVFAAGKTAANEPAATIVLKPYLGDLKAIDVTVGGRTLPFLFDTGGGMTFLTPEIAKAVGCTPFGRLTGFRSVGERIDFQRCGKVVLGFGSFSVEVEPGVYDLMPLLKQQGDVPEVGGIISLDLFADLPITLNFARDTLIIESSASLAERIQQMKPLSVRTSRQAGGATLDLFVEVKAKTGTIWLELDSGNAGPVRISPHAVTQLGLEAGLNERLPITLDVPELGLLRNEAYVDERIYDGLLNTIFLNGIVLTVDLSANRAWAVQRDQ